MTTKKSPPTVPEQPPINPEPEQEPEDLQEDALAPEPSAKPRLDMDLINDYLTEVSESSSSDPATMATTAIRHFTNLLQLCQRLATAVAYQTTAIQRLLDTDLAHLTTQSPTIPQWGQGPGSASAFEAPQNPDPAFNVPWPGQEQPRPQTPVAPMAQPQGFGQPWQKLTPEQFMAQQAQQQAQQAQQAPPAPAPQQDPLYQQWLAQQGQPQYSGPARNGQVIEARGAHGNLLDQISAPPPPIPSGFGGSPLAGGPKNNMRWDRV